MVKGKFLYFIRVALLSLLLLLAILFITLPRLIRTNWMTSIIQENLSTNLGRKISLKSPPILELGSAVSLALDGIKIEPSGNNTAGQTISIEKFSVSGPTLANILGKHILHNLQANDLVVTVDDGSDKQSYKISQLNLQDITGESTADSLTSIKIDHFLFTSGTNDLSGKIAINFSPLIITADLKSNNLDLASLTGASQHNNKKSNTAEPRFPFEIFSGFAAELNLEAANLVTFLGLRFNDVKLSAKVEDSALKVQKLSAKSLGGDISGTFEAKNKSLKVILNGKHFDSNPVTQLAGGTPLIEGKFDLDLALDGKGSLLSEILSSLTGTLNLSSTNAKMHSATLETASSSLFGIVKPIFGGSRHTSIDCLMFNYDLKNGVAKSREQVLKLGDAIIFASGSLNFPSNQLQYDFHVSSKNPTIVSLIPPFQASGKLSKPHFMPTISGTVASIFDTTEGLARSATGLITDTARTLVGIEAETEALGLEICKQAYASDQNLFSSKFGRALEHLNP